MEKRQAISIISQAAKIYNEVFNARCLLLVFGAPNAPSIIETTASMENFLHLTGVVLNKNIKDNTPVTFFENARDNKLKEVEFDFKNSTTEQKLRVLVQTLNLSNAKMIGNFLTGRVNLKTDKIAGGICSFLGFIKAGKRYVPNTVMADDIRKNTACYQRVLAILSKGINEQSYNEIKYVAKKIDIDKLLGVLKNVVSLSPNLLLSAQPNADAAQITAHSSAVNKDLRKKLEHRAEIIRSLENEDNQQNTNASEPSQQDCPDDDEDMEW